MTVFIFYLFRWSRHQKDWKTWPLSFLRFPRLIFDMWSLLFVAKTTLCFLNNLLLFLFGGRNRGKKELCIFFNIFIHICNNVTINITRARDKYINPVTCTSIKIVYIKLFPLFWPTIKRRRTCRETCMTRLGYLPTACKLYYLVTGPVTHFVRRNKLTL